MTTVQHTNKSEQDTLWKDYDLPISTGTNIHKIGSAKICIRVEENGDGYLLAAMPSYQNSTMNNTTVSLPPLDNSAWTRLFIKNTSHYHLQPCYPNIPMCIKIQYPFLLPPGADIKGWVFSVADIQIMSGNATLVSLPLHKPYKTLYGSADKGVVCRYGEAQFLASDEPMFAALLSDPGMVAHPVRLKNISSEPVLVTELCIYGEQLSIFGKGSILQSERLLFIFSTLGVRMSLDTQEIVPSDWTIIAKPRLSGEERFIVRSFEVFKAITKL